jgi:hypothetical protein
MGQLRTVLMTLAGLHFGELGGQFAMLIGGGVAADRIPPAFQSRPELPC